MKILKLKSENVLNLKAVEITPDGNAVVLTGANGAGKSAILDSIFFTLTGSKVDELIRNGQDKAKVEIDLGTYLVRKVWTHKTERLEVLGKDGAVYPKPQSLLNKIIGDLSFDPLAFKNLKEKDQRDLLAKLVGLDFSILDLNRNGLYQDRTAVGRDLSRAEAALTRLVKPEEGLPAEEITLEKHFEEIDKLEAKQREHADYEEKVKELDGIKADNLCEIVRLEGRIQTLKASIAAIDQERADLKEPDNVSDDEIAGARKRIHDIEALNAKIRNSRAYTLAEAEIAKHREAYSELTGKIEAIDMEKSGKAEEAVFPIEGLFITDTAVMYQKVKGEQAVPFKQLSTGQAIKVSTAIAMALNPGVKIIMIRDASLLDEAGMKAIVDLAREKDYQLWLEVVDDTGKMGIYIEEGEIKPKGEE
ncbi:MAG: AAA family ATPase [Candidatus Omnitrophota bacterium]|jgi:DNA repair exonuclease SbcCD ATPase subunit